MKRVLTGLVLIGIIISLGNWIRADKQPDIKELIPQLGIDNPQQRNQVQKELTNFGEKLIDKYRSLKAAETPESKLNTVKEQISILGQALQIAGKETNIEIKTRAVQILKHLYSLTASQIVFISYGGTNRRLNDTEIFVISADGSNQKRLTNNHVRDSYPAWSPDGKQIVFNSAQPGVGGICVMDADGSNQRYLRGGRFPIWSPDGKRISSIFNHGQIPGRQPSFSQIYVMDTDGSNRKRLSKNWANESSCSWSPDGEKIAFLSDYYGSSDYEIYVMDVDGSNQKCLTENKRHDDCPAWSPDGKKIAFESCQDGNFRIYVMNADGSNQRCLTKDHVYSQLSDLSVRNPWSPNGKQIVFYSIEEGTVRDNKCEIYVTDADGSNQRRLTNNQAQDESPSWSPDGKQIAFVSSRDGRNEIYIMNADGSNQRRLTTNGGSNPSWSPLSLFEISELFTNQAKKGNNDVK